MASYYSRYLAGGRVEVWNELMQLGGHIHPLLQADAMDVCREIVNRTAFNLTLLHRRLIDVGYKFASPDESLVEATTQDTIALALVEQSLGQVPLILRAWYERLHSINFSQDESQLHGEAASSGNPDPVAGLGCNLVLIVLDLQSCQRLRATVIGNESDSESLVRLQHFFPSGGWASNCDPKGFILPNTGVDGVFYNEGFGNVTFVDELRLAFDAGGFPFWRHLLQTRRRSYPISVPPDYARLRPILCEGLVPI